MVAQMVKNLPAVQETRVQSLSWEYPLEKIMATYPVFLPGKSHGERSLMGYSPWGCKESNTTATDTFSIKQSVLERKLQRNFYLILAFLYESSLLLTQMQMSSLQMGN